MEGKAAIDDALHSFNNAKLADSMNEKMPHI